jgi:hypothetical protein
MVLDKIPRTRVVTAHIGSGELLGVENHIILEVSVTLDVAL